MSSFIKKNQKVLQEKANKYELLFTGFLADGYGVKFVIDYIRSYIKTVFNVPEITNTTSCKAGCYFCCHDKIFLSVVEKAYFKKYVKNIPDLKQMKLLNDTKDFSKLPWIDKRCGFLSSANTCTIYNERPLVCRTHNSKDDPELCKIDENNKSGNHAQAYNIELQAMEIALMLMSDMNEFWLHELYKK